MLVQTFSHKLNTYHPHHLDAYLLHLADTHNTCCVVAIDDIYSSLGELIVERGVFITPKLARNIMHHTLAKPLEESVRLEQELNTAQLEADFISAMKHDDGLLSIHDRHDLTVSLKSLCQNVTQHAVLRQKLTVMAQVLPNVYQRGLYCAWLSFLIAKEMRLTEQDIELIFIAALSHDIGMLHVNADILNRKATLTSEECIQLQMHVVIGSQIIHAIPHLPVAVAQAVYEHHERCDGTGYPHGKVESELSLSGLILGLADSVVAIYFHRFKSQGGSWRDAIPIIQMNAQAYFYRNSEILATLLRRSELPLKNVVQGDETPDFIRDLEEKNVRLQCWFETMRECLLALGFRHGDRRLYSLQNVMLHVSTSVEGSGIFNERPPLLLQLQNGNLPEDAHQEIERTHLMQQEIVFHLQRVSRMTQLYLDSDECKADEIKTMLITGLENSKKLIV